jgi:acetyl esterase/lipase
MSVIGRRGVALPVAVVLFGGLVVAACTDTTTGTTEADTAGATALAEHLTGTEEYLPGLAADVYLPPGRTTAPLVVIVPGGGWESADRSGLGPLADGLADAGLMAVTITYRTGTEEARFPIPAEDIACAVRFASTRAMEAGIDARPLVLAGHSAGAHLAAVVALAPDLVRGDCPYPAASPDALVGLAGPYDLLAVGNVAWPLLGATAEQDPDRWEEASALTYAAARPELPVLLAHGDADELVPLEISIEFADALQATGHTVRMETLPGADHTDLYDPQIASLIVEWIDSLRSPPSMS